ncbi:helix-turn-helix domain-containing protein [Cohnella endophytica]|nr:helix-turn-helix domain-containing protein [Cohnella endophytica]
MILHPIRMRIIQALINGSRMTSQQIQERLEDVPQATMYRHLKKMVDAGVLEVAEEIPNRGTLEKVYRLPEKGAIISAEDLKRASPEDHLSFFMNYAAQIIGEYGNYVKQPDLDLVQDGVSYRQISLYLSDEENIQLLTALWEILMKAIQNQPDENRRRRLISIIDFPQSGKKTAQQQREDLH